MLAKCLPIRSVRQYLPNVDFKIISIKQHIIIFFQIIRNIMQQVTLLKNQMKSAMMAKPADKNDPVGQQPREGHPLRPGQPGDPASIEYRRSDVEITSVDNDGSSSRLGVRAVGKANPNLTIGGRSARARMAGKWPASGTNASNDGDKTRVRHPARPMSICGSTTRTSASSRWATVRWPAMPVGLFAG